LKTSQHESGDLGKAAFRALVKTLMVERGESEVAPLPLSCFGIRGSPFLYF
jgi:hypothetical protein